MRIGGFLIDISSERPIASFSLETQARDGESELSVFTDLLSAIGAQKACC